MFENKLKCRARVYPTPKTYPLLFTLLLLLCTACSAGCGADDSENKDSDSSTGSDADTDTDTHMNGIERLYYFPWLEKDGWLYTLGVDETHIYFEINLSLARAIKTGGGELETIGGGMTGSIIANLVIDDTYIYWLNGKSVSKWNKETKATTSLSLEGNEGDFYSVIASDDKRLYITEVGCPQILSMSKNGGDIRVSKQEITGTISGSSMIALSESHVYCSGGEVYRQKTSGSMYRAPKEGGDIEYVTQIPDPNNSSSQVGPMVILGDTVYFAEIYSGGGAPGHKLAMCPATGGDTTIIREPIHRDTYRLHYDEKRNALYWMSILYIYRYTLDTKEFVQIELPDARWPIIAWDEDYLYWPGEASIYRIKKF